MVTIKSRSSSSSATAYQSRTPDVFLSFRGIDTRNNIVSHLHRNLVRKGIKTFLDDDGLRRGANISSELHKAILDSKVSVVMFSQNYAYSKWCLEELVKILECQETNKQMVYPVFYKVDPSDVRNQKGSYGKALAYHEDKGHLEKVVRWKEALKKAGNMSGKHFKDGGNESKLVDEILEEVSAQLLHRARLYVAKYPVGIQSRVQDVLKLLSVGGDGVRMVAIWGVGGIGKTTLAKAVYNSVAYQFEDSCFLANVREGSMTSGGVVSLQKIMISEIAGWKDLHFTSVDQGITMIKEFMTYKRVLLILDDVNHLNQLFNLVGKQSWFGPGSRIIITTRDKGFLTGYRVKEIYEVKKLSHHEAEELFNLNAFQDPKPLKDYVELVKNVLLYAQGLPLALEVLAANMCGRDVIQCKYVLDSYRSLPKQEIQEILIISYHTLEDQIKQAFLHIACFFKGKSKDYVTKILGACNIDPENAIVVLEEKSLIVVTEENTIQMHDLIEEMGREVVFRESPQEPGQRSRLWRYEDVYDVFVKDKGSDKVQGIVVNNWNDREKEICLTSISFSALKNLEIFIVSGNMFTGDHVNYLSNKMRVVDWLYCPLLSFPSEFNPIDLVIFNLPSSQMSPLWEETKILFQLKMPWSGKSSLGKGAEIMRSLKYIDLSYSHRLTNLGNFSRFPNLVDLNLSGCQNLVEVDPSIGLLENISSLNLGFCKKLTKFELELMQDMKSLKCLDLSGTAIREISSSIRYLISLEKLTLQQCAKLKNVSCSIFELQHLRYVDLFWCDSLVTFPTKSEFAISVRGKYYEPLSVSLDSCTNLQEISVFPREIDDLNLRCCSALKRMSKLSNILEGKESKMIRRLNLYDCGQLFVTKNHLLNEEDDLLSLFLSCQRSPFEVLFPSDILDLRRHCKLPNREYGWQEHMDANCMKIEFSKNFNWENSGLAFCADRYSSHRGPYFTSCTVYINGVCIIEPFEENKQHPWRLSNRHMWVYYIPFHTVIKRLNESGLPPPFMCLVNFELGVERSEERFDKYRRYVVVSGNKDDVTFPLRPMIDRN